MTYGFAQRGSLLNLDRVAEIIENDRMAWTHNANWEGPNNLGYGIMYYAYVYALRARVAVCLGSGYGFVPKMMRQAQRDLGEEFAQNSVTILVDYGYFENEYYKTMTWFREEYPEIAVLQYTTHDAVELFVKTGMPIDFLHIDADHHYLTMEGTSGAKHDIDAYAPLMSKRSLITMHDGILFPVLYAIQELKADPGYEVCNFPPCFASLATVRKVPEDEQVWNMEFPADLDKNKRPRVDRGTSPVFDPEVFQEFMTELKEWRGNARLTAD